MYRTKLLRTLILTAFLGFTVTAVAAKKVDVYKEFQKKVDQLEASLKKEKDAKKRYDLYWKTYTDLAELRDKNPRQAEENELNMSLFMDTVAYLPAKADFKVEKCPQYKKEAQDQMKSYDKKQVEPFVDRANKVIALICP